MVIVHVRPRECEGSDANSENADSAKRVAPFPNTSRKPQEQRTVHPREERLCGKSHLPAGVAGDSRDIDADARRATLHGARRGRTAAM